MEKFIHLTCLLYANSLERDDFETKRISWFTGRWISLKLRDSPKSIFFPIFPPVSWLILESAWINSKPCISNMNEPFPYIRIYIQSFDTVILYETETEWKSDNGGRDTDGRIETEANIRRIELQSDSQSYFGGDRVKNWRANRYNGEIEMQCIDINVGLSNPLASTRSPLRNTPP